MTFPILTPRTVLLVSTLRAALDRDGTPDAEHWRLVEDLIEQLTPDFQRDSEPRWTDDRVVKLDVMTCGTCGRSWDDALGSHLTPVPSGRCPFEYDHCDIDHDEIRDALEGDSNDREHDALVMVAEALSIRWAAPEW